MMMISIDDLPEADGKEAEIHAHASCSIKTKKKKKKDSRVVKNARLVRHAFVRSKSRTKGKKNQESKICKATSKIFASLLLLVFRLLLVDLSKTLQSFSNAR
jgi:hypothetical protein